MRLSLSWATGSLRAPPRMHGPRLVATRNNGVSFTGVLLDDLGQPVDLSLGGAVVFSLRAVGSAYLDGQVLAVPLVGLEGANGHVDEAEPYDEPGKGGRFRIDVPASALAAVGDYEGELAYYEPNEIEATVLPELVRVFVRDNLLGRSFALYPALLLNAHAVYLDGLPVYLNWEADMPINIGSPTVPATPEQLAEIREALGLNDEPALVTQNVSTSTYALQAADASNATLGQETHKRFTHAAPTVTLDGARTGLPFVLRVAPGTELTLTLTGGAQVNGAADDIVVTAAEAAAVLALLPTGTAQRWDGITGSGGATAVEPPTLSITSPTVAEAAGYAIFALSLSAATDEAIALSLSLTAGTATSGTDYTTAMQVSTNGGSSWTTANTVTIDAGQTSAQVRVPITNDTADESAETFTLTASVTSGETANPFVIGTATITDDDEPAPGPSTSLSQQTRLTDFGTTPDILYIDLMPGGVAVPTGATVVVGWISTEWHAFSLVTDNQNNTYSQDLSLVGSQTGERGRFYRCSNVTNGPTRARITASQGVGLRLFAWVESADLAATSPLDQTDNEPTTGTNTSSSTVTTAFANETMLTMVKPSSPREPTAVSPSELLVLGAPATATAYWGLRRTTGAAGATYTNAATFTGAVANTDSFSVTYKPAGA